MPNDHVFAGFPTTHIVSTGDEAPPLKKGGGKAIKELLWGDYITVLGESGRWYKARCRGVTGWIHKDDTQTERLLEIVFVDIGQGDGTLVITPDDRKYVIDAGEGDNMLRFLRWRFGGFKKPIQFDAAIVSHSDMDHYGGFNDLFNEKNLTFGALYHNGLVEREAAEDDILGPRVKIGDNVYIQDLVPDLAELRARLNDPSFVGKKKYPKMLKRALDAGKFADFRMLSVGNGHMPRHGRDDALPIEILGPFPETVNGAPALRCFPDAGKTKNGHSVVLRLIHGNLRVFLGGDLNTFSSDLLLELHSGIRGDVEAQIAAAAPKLECDVAKACHHGSADTRLSFLRAINPIVTVVSSGDNEPHAHPRADALGALGRYGRGTRPLIFSTELARSSKEAIKHPHKLRAQIEELDKTIHDSTLTAEKRDAARLKRDKILGDVLDRSVAVFGAINLRSDGNRVVLAYKMERGTAKTGWDVYALETTGPGGQLEYRSKYDR